MRGTPGPTWPGRPGGRWLVAALVAAVVLGIVACGGGVDDAGEPRAGGADRASDGPDRVPDEPDRASDGSDEDGSDEEARARAADLRAGPNLVLITLDTLRADHLPPYGYDRVETPSLDRIAAEGVRFAEVASPVPITLPAHASIMTGQYPPVHGVRHNATHRLQDEALTLAELLRERGWATAAFVASFVLDRRFGIAQGFDEYTDFSGLEAEAVGRQLLALERRGDEVVDDALEWLDGRREGRGEPFFAWVHLYDPHSPYEPPEPYASRYADRPYDGEIAFTDEMVGRLIDGIGARGLAEDTLVVVAADHGEGLGDHQEEFHIYYVYDSTVRVPLILWAPGSLPEGLVVEGQASLVDILPTALGLLGVEDPVAADRQGVDLRGAMATPGSTGSPAYSESLVPLLTFGWSELRALRFDGWKYIAAPRPELYDLRADPGETRNLVETEADRAADLRGRLEQLVGDEDPGDLVAGQETMDPETLERLRSLGYIGGGGSVADHREVDPKDRIDVFQAYLHGLDEVEALVREERWAEAVPRLRELERLAPDQYLVQYYLGKAALARGDVDAAIDHLETSLEVNPSYTLTFVELARAYRRAGRTQRGIELLREGLQAYPDSFLFPFNLGYLFHMERRLDDALAAYREAREILPRHPKLLSNMANVYLMQRRPQPALESLETVVEIQPDDAAAWGNLGTVHGALGQMDEAERAFRRALELQPGQARLHYNLGLVLLRQGRAPEAREAFERALEIDPSLEAARAQLRRLQRVPGEGGGGGRGNPRN